VVIFPPIKVLSRSDINNPCHRVGDGVDTRFILHAGMGRSRAFIVRSGLYSLVVEASTYS